MFPAECRGCIVCIILHDTTLCPELAWVCVSCTPTCAIDECNSRRDCRRRRPHQRTQRKKEYNAAVSVDLSSIPTCAAWHVSLARTHSTCLQQNVDCYQAVAIIKGLNKNSSQTNTPCNMQTAKSFHEMRNWNCTNGSNVIQHFTYGPYASCFESEADSETKIVASKHSVWIQLLGASITCHVKHVWINETITNMIAFP